MPAKIITCVLKTGGDVYNEAYVDALAKACARRATAPYEFVCITDSNGPFCKDVHKVIKLQHAFPGWWSKIELFNQPYFVGKDILFFDLDTVLIGDINPILRYNPQKFMALEDFYRPDNLGSGMLYFQGGKFNAIYEKFMHRPIYIMRNFPEGDQQWIELVIPFFDKLQNVFPKMIVSFKKHVLGPHRNYDKMNWDADMRVICFHGVPKPHNVTQPLISDNWKPVDS